MARLGGAAAVLVSGLVHIQLYYDGYRDFPLDANLGRSFILQGIVSVLIVAGLLVTKHAGVRLAGIVALGGTLAAFALSRTDKGIFKFAEKGLEPSPQALLSLLAGIIGIVLLAATFLPAIGAGAELDKRMAGAGSLAVALVAVVGAALWAQTDTPDEMAGPSSEAPSATSAAPGSTAPTDSAPGATSMPDMSMPDMSMPAGPATTAEAGTPTTAAAPAETTAAAEDGVMEISIVDFAFDPPTLEVPVGTTVRWTNNDSFAHNVVADDGSFMSETLDSGDVFEFTFETAGEFPYICGIHPSMVGSIVVTA